MIENDELLFDDLYINLFKEIINHGVEVKNRTGVNTIKLPSYNLHFDLRKEFPILKTKQIAYKSAIIEMLWIWQMGSNNVKELQNRGIKIWNEWMVDGDGIYRIYEPYGEYDPNKEVNVIDPLSVPVSDPYGYRHPFDYKRDENGNIMKAKSLIEGKTIKAAKYYGPEFAYTIGTAYGFINNLYEMAINLQYALKNCQGDRRIVNSLYQNEYLRQAVLPPCVWSNEWGVTNGELNLLVHQRSCDVPLGLPFNVTQYAALLLMMAHVTNLEATTMDFSIKDAHIYVNQYDMVKEQIQRYDRYIELKKMKEEDVKHILEETKQRKEQIEDKKSKEYLYLDTEERICDMVLHPLKTRLELDPSITDFFDFDNSRELKNLKLVNYKHMGKLNIPITQ